MGSLSDLGLFNLPRASDRTLMSTSMAGVTGSLFHFLFVLYTYYLYEMYKSVLQRCGGQGVGLYNIYPPIAKCTTIL